MSQDDDAIVTRMSRTLFHKEKTEDPWERTFLLFFEPLREEIRRATKLEVRVRELVLELARLTAASSNAKGRVQTAMREMAMTMATSLHRVAVAVLSETQPQVGAKP